MFRLLTDNIATTKLVFLLALFGCFLSVVSAQEQGTLRKEVLENQPVEKPENDKKPEKKSTPSSEPASTNKTIVYLEHTDLISVDEDLRPGVQLLKGSVRFRHDNALMYCDSAYFYQDKNSLDAFSNVRIIQADTIFVYGDLLFYDGNTKLARLRKNVRLENKTAVLTTDSLNYDRQANLAYYYTGGKIKDELNTLTSVWGQYSPSTEQAQFRKNVKLVNPSFTMDSDTLKYNTQTNIASIVGPTHIIYKEETDIYSNLGWYNTSNEKSMLLNRSLIVHKDGKSLTGDTVFYDKPNYYGEAFINVELTDSVQMTTLKGNYVNYNELTEKGLATDSALLVDWSSADTMYIHADTLQTYKDSIYDLAQGHYNVRIFRSDVQGVCDSLIYSSNDSIINLYGAPVLWAEGSQLSGDHIKVLTKNQKVDKINIQPNAIASQKVDSTLYNQLSGKEIIAYLDSGELKRIFVDGNAETIYYPIDDADSVIIGQNKSQSSFVTMYFENRKVSKILLTTVSNGNFNPLGDLSEDDFFLSNFFWLENDRPVSPSDMFRRNTEAEKRRSPRSTKRKSGSAASTDEVPKDAPSRGNLQMNPTPSR